MSKGRPFENLSVSACPGHHNITLDDQTTPRLASHSYIELALNFRDNTALRESMLRFDNSIRYGILLEILDALAADVAHRHVGYFKRLIVTASVEDMYATQLITPESNLRLHAYLTHVGRSSMEVRVDHITRDNDDNDTYIGTVNFIMVAKDPITRKAQGVPPLLSLNQNNTPNDITTGASSDADADGDMWLKYWSYVNNEGNARKEERKKRAKESLGVKPPRPDEVGLVHSLHLQVRTICTSKCTTLY